MNLYFRFLVLIVKSIFNKKATDPFACCSTKFWVNLLDIDLNFHMNNGRYLSIMDLGRFDLMLKSKVFWKLFLAGYYPVVVSEGIKFKAALMPFSFFTLETKIEAWNEKDFYMSQKFFHQNKLYAEGYLKGRFKRRGQKGSVPTKEIFQMLGHSFDSDVTDNKSQALDLLDNNLAKTDLTA